MLIRNLVIGALAICGSATAFAAPTADAMRAASAVQTNVKYSFSISLTRDADGNIVSFHVNGVNPDDASILLKREPSPLSSEYTIVTGINREGGTATFMLPSNIATAHVISSISQDLVNAGAVNIQITRQQSGKL